MMLPVARSIALCCILIVCMPAAKACSPLPPPARETGEAETDYVDRVHRWEVANRLARQNESWARATTVLLVEIGSAKPYGDRELALTKTTVRVVRPLKGRAGPVGFTFKPIGTCLPEDTVASRAIGDTLVLFFDRETPSKKGLIDAVPVPMLVEPDLLKAVADAK